MCCGNSANDGIAREDLPRELALVIRKSPGLAAYIARRIIHGRNKPPVPLAEIPLICTAEQLPKPEEPHRPRQRPRCVRVATGRGRLAALLAEDQRGIVTADTLLADELSRSGFGRLRSAIPGRRRRLAQRPAWRPAPHGNDPHASRPEARRRRRELPRPTESRTSTSRCRCSRPVGPSIRR